MESKYCCGTTCDRLKLIAEQKNGGGVPRQSRGASDPQGPRAFTKGTRRVKREGLDDLSYPRLIAALLCIAGAWLLFFVGVLWLVRPV